MRTAHEPSLRESAPVERIRFGPFSLEPTRGELRRDGAIVPLRPLATRALLLLVAGRGHLVGRRELRRRLWGESSLEWETGLHQILRQIRRALGDDPRDPVYIETVTRRGYRFIAPIEEDAQSAPAPPPHPSWRSNAVWLTAGALASPLLLVAVCALLAS